MTTIDTLVLLVISGALGFVGVYALWFRRELRAVTAERDEARQTLALLTAMPEGHVCTEQVFYTRHWYGGHAGCLRCGKIRPYVRRAPETAGSAEEDTP